MIFLYHLSTVQEARFKPYKPEGVYAAKSWN